MKYQDLVIKDGKFIGEFEKLYKDFENPWKQNDKRVKNDSRKAIVKNFLKNLALYQKKKLIVSEIGCGFGNTSNILNSKKIFCFGTDISKTAILKAKEKYPKCEFFKKDFLDFKIHKEKKTQIFLLQEITWYVLPKLKNFLKKLHDHKIKINDDIYLIHLLTIYGKKEQKYGLEYFSNLKQILNFFDLNYEEYGQIEIKDDNGMFRKFTYFIAKI